MPLAFNNNLLIQFGFGHLQQSTTITLPIPYTTTTYVPVGTFYGDSAGFSLGFKNKTITNMVAYAYNETKYFHWITIGS